MAEPGRRVVRLSISGRVQGVGFRFWTVGEATRLGLDGWVRNRADGTVEALAAGPPEAVDALVDRCRQGPPMARVDGIAVMEAAEPGVSGFREETTR